MVVTGLPEGLAFDGDQTISGTPSVLGTYSVWVSATDNGTPQLSGSTGFTWGSRRMTVRAHPRSNRDQSTKWASRVEILPERNTQRRHLTWSAEGLPPGVEIDPTTGRIFGTTTEAGDFSVGVTVTDESGLQAGVTFHWTVAEGLPTDESPLARDDFLDAVEADLADGTLTIDVLANDTDPEAGSLRIVSVGGVEVGSVSIIGSRLVFTPPSSWEGTTVFTYVVADETGNTSTARVTVTLVRDTFEIIGGSVLTFVPPEPTIRGPEVISLNPGEIGQLAVTNVLQSLYVLRMPLTLLGGTVVWSLLLGGLLNLGMAIRPGSPLFFRRPSGRWPWCSPSTVPRFPSMLSRGRARSSPSSVPSRPASPRPARPSESLASSGCRWRRTMGVVGRSRCT